MRTLSIWTLPHASGERTIELLQGDLAHLPVQHHVDILVVSAFPEDYLPTPTSLIGALNRVGLSVARLSGAKEADLRKQFSCWLSKPVEPAFGFRRLLCIESGWRGTVPQITDDLFRCLTPFLVSEYADASVAMPVIGAGDQGWPLPQMLRSILQSAAWWIDRGLALHKLKIVLSSERESEEARATFDRVRDEWQHAHKGGGAEKDAFQYDLFLSYSHADTPSATRIAEALASARPEIRVFFDKSSVQLGDGWMMKLAKAVDNSKRVAAVWTPEYWESPYCQQEFCAALTRQNDTGVPVLLTIYLRTTNVPYFFKNQQFEDCREGDLEKLAAACGKIRKYLT